MAPASGDQAGLPPGHAPSSLPSSYRFPAIRRLKLQAPSPHLHDWLERTDFDLSRHEAVLPILTSKDAEVLVAGRVGSQVWQFLERETACRVRFFSEERGMQASGRDSSGQVRSLLGYHVQQVGQARIANWPMCNAAFIDTASSSPTSVSALPPDHFLSDIGRYGDMSTPSSMNSPKRRWPRCPSALLVAGGIIILAELAWSGDRAAWLGLLIQRPSFCPTEAEMVISECQNSAPFDPPHLQRKTKP
jgi:hypothetical protein